MTTQGVVRASDHGFNNGDTVKIMSKKASPKLIGAFVIGGFALAVGAVAVFATGRFFQETTRWVVFFDQSVRGLKVGSPVTFRGVEIGAVTEIVVEYNYGTSDIRVPVVIEIHSERIDVIGVEDVSSDDDDEGPSRLIDKGLRAQLQIQSLVTGQQMVQLDFFPNSDPKYSGDYPLREFPTVPSDMSQLQESVEEVTDLAPALITNATELLAHADELLNEENKAAVAGILANLESFTGTLADSDDEIAEIMSGATSLIANLNEASEGVETIVDNIAENRDSFNAAIVEVGEAGAAVERMADQINGMIAENRPGLRDFSSEGLYEITGLAQDGQDMFDQISRVADELERDPSRFLFGDRQQGVNTQ